MRRLGRLLGHAAYVVAWLIVVVTIGTLIVEKGPWLRDAVRGRLAEELGPLGPALTIEEVRVHWLKPAIELRKVRLERQEGELLLDSVYVGLDPAPESEQRLRFVRVSGGRLDVYESLYDDVREVLRTRQDFPSAEEVAGEAMQADLPPILIEGVEIAFVTPRFGRLPLGEVGGHLAFDPDGPTLRGEVRPSFREAGSEASIQFQGHMSDETFTLSAECPGVALSLSSDRYREVRELLPIESPRGVLRLAANAELRRDGSAPPEGEVFISIDGCSFAPRAPLPPVEALDLELAAAFAPGENRGLYSPKAWSISGRFEGRTFDTPLSGWIRAGVGAEDAVLEGWAHVPALPLGREVLATLRNSLGDTPEVELAERYWRMFEPEGTADTAVSMRIPRLWDPIEKWEVVADLILDDGLRRAAWHGQPLRPGEGREGIPVVARDFTGRVVLARSPARPPADRFALVDIVGRHGSGSVSVDGVISTPESPGFGPDVDVTIQVPSIAIDDTLLTGLAGHRATRLIESQYRPRGGRAAGTIRLRGGPRSSGFTAAVDAVIEGADASWAGLPVPVTDLDGRLAIRWAEESNVQPNGYLGHRPVGVRFAGGGRFGSSTQQSVEVEVLWRESSEFGAVRPLGEKLPSLLAVDVDMRRMFFRGADWDTIVATLPEVQRQVDAYHPLGWADVRFRFGQAWLDAPPTWVTEVTPGDLEIVPAVFPRPTTAVRGRVIVQGTAPPGSGLESGIPDGEGDAGQARAAVRASSKVSLAGTWLQDSGPVQVAALADVSSEGVGVAHVFAAGVDPSNKALLGSLAEAMEAEGKGRGLDLSALGIDGFLDFAGELPLVPDARRDRRGPASPNVGDGPLGEPARYRIFLRSNALAVDQFKLSGMRGVLVQENGILRGNRIQAMLGSTPVVLESPHFLSTEDLPRIESANRALEQLGITPEPGGYVLTSSIDARAPVPLDAEHLGLFFDEQELVTVLEKAAIRGTLSFQNASFVLTGDGLGRGNVAVGGPVELRDFGVLLGLPIEVDYGELLIHSLVFEAGQVRGWLDLSGVEGSIADRAIRDTDMMVTYVNGRLSIDQLDALFDFGGDFDGRLISLGGESGGGHALALDLGEPYEFELNLELQKVKLDGLLRGLFDTGFSEPGRVDAILSLRGRPGSLNDVTGGGFLRLYEARLWSIPVARELFAQLGFDDTATFQEMRTRFDIEGGEIQLSGMQAKSPLAKLVGRGKVDLDGSLAVDLEVRYGLIDNFGPLNRLLYQIQNSLLKVAIRGDLARPFVILRNGFAELLWRFKGDVRALPLPPFQELPERF